MNAFKAICLVLPPAQIDHNFLDPVGTLQCTYIGSDPVSSPRERTNNMNPQPAQEGASCMNPM